MDRLLAGPPASLARRATERRTHRATGAVRRVRPDAGVRALSSVATPGPRIRARLGRASRNSAILAAGIGATSDIKQEDFLDKTSMAPAELLRAARETLTEARSAMPLAMRAATKKAAPKKTAAKKPAAKKPAARKAAPKKAAAKRTTTARKPAAKKAPAKKPAARKTAAAKKPAARKTAAKKPAKAAAKKPAVRRPRKAAAPAAPAPADATS
jgi:hypothetical protein